MSTTRFGADHEGAATVLREIGYRGRQALVVTKQALGLSRRGDKTFYVEQFSRLLRSGSVNASGIATIGRTDGAGAQAQALMSAIAFAHAHNLPYVHRPFTSIEHAEMDMPAWVQLWEDYFNLGAGEASLDIDGAAAGGARSFALRAAPGAGDRRRRALSALLQPGSARLGEHPAAAALQVLAEQDPRAGAPASCASPCTCGAAT